MLVGKAGANLLDGGAGNDTFVFQAIADSRVEADYRDTILDCTRGQDRISLSAIDANTALAGDQAFSFIGTAGFSGVAGQLRVTAYGNTCLIDGDVNGQSWMTGG